MADLEIHSDSSEGRRPPKYLLVEALRKSIDLAVEYASRPESLAAAEEYDAFEPDDGEFYLSRFRSIERFLTIFVHLDLNELPLDLIENVTRQVDSLGELTRRLIGREFRGKSSDPKLLFDALYDISNTFQSVIDLLNPWLPLMTLKSLPLADIDLVRNEISTLEVSINDAKAESKTAISEVKEIINRLEGMETAGKAVLANIGVDKHAGNFLQVQSDHGSIANKWLIASIISSAVAIITPFLLFLAIPVDGEWSSPANINKIVIKAVLLFGIFYVVSQCVRNYKINRHLEVVNRHRATALATFRSFVEASGGDADIKNQILLEATRTIFAPVSTGYVPDDNDNAEGRLMALISAVKGK